MPLEGNDQTTEVLKVEFIGALVTPEARVNQRCFGWKKIVRMLPWTRG